MSKDLEILVQNMQNDNVSEEEIASVIQLSEKNRKRKKDPPNPHGIPENDYKRIRKSLRKEYGFIPFRRKKRSGELPVIPTPRLGNKPKGLGGIGGSIPGRMGRPPAPRVSPRLAGPQMSTGGSVKVKVKLGRNKPTKLF